MGIRSDKDWYDRRSRKLSKKKKRVRKSGYSNQAAQITQFDREYSFAGEHRAVAPKTFSFLDNLEETAEMFSGLIEEIRNGVYGRRFFFDSSGVEKITTDVLVYIISIMRNMKCNKTKHYTFAGNLPKNNEAKRIYEESGLYKYVQTKNGNLPQNNEKMQIITGKKTDSLLASQICKFVMEKFKVSKVYTQFLYVTIIELMSNAVHHAYNDREEIMYPCWYLCVEHHEEKIRFVFVDTGLGIATTVRKRVYENIKFITSDADLIESAFAGEFRTETKQPNRGLGLPALKEFVLKGRKFSEFFVLSGNGGYKYMHNGQFEKVEIKNRIYGTIYIFEMAREEIIT